MSFHLNSNSNNSKGRLTSDKSNPKLQAGTGLYKRTLIGVLPNKQDPRRTSAGSGSSNRSVLSSSLSRGQGSHASKTFSGTTTHGITAHSRTQLSRKQDSHASIPPSPGKRPPPSPPLYSYPDHLSHREHASRSPHSLLTRHKEADSYITKHYSYTLDHSATEGHYSSRPRDSGIAPRASGVSTPRLRRREEKEEKRQSSSDDSQLPGVHRSSLRRRSSSVAECLNHVGSSSSPTVPAPVRPIGSHTSPAYNPNDYHSGTKFTPISTGGHACDPGISATSALRTKSTSISPRGNRNLAADLLSRPTTTTAAVATASSAAQYSSPTQFSSFTDRRANPYHRDFSSSSMSSNAFTTASEQDTLTTTTMATKLDSGEKSRLSSSRKLSPKTRLYVLLRISRKKNSSREGGIQLSLADIEGAYLNSDVVGLINLGNTCYMNSTIQCLSHTLELTDIFLCSNDRLGPMCSEYKKAMQQIWFQPDRSRNRSTSPIGSSPFRSLSKSYLSGSISLRGLKELLAAKHPQFRGYMENDAQELLRHLIGDLHAEMKPKPSGKAVPREVSSLSNLSARDQGNVMWELTQSQEGSPISDIFMGQFKSSLQCSVCNYCSLTFESFWDLGLPLPKSSHSSVDLESCLSKFSRNEVMDGNNKPLCIRCRKLQCSVKTMTIQRFPPILTLYLKRFSSYGTIGKLYNSVTVQKSMDLSAFASPETVEDLGGGGICYELYGVINHSGTIYGGHYTADVKHFASQRWYSISDSRVTKSSILDMQSKFTSKEAYILFYRRVSN